MNLKKKKLEQLEKRIDTLEKLSRSRLISLVKKYYKDIDLVGSSKWDLIWTILKAEYGRAHCKKE